MFEKEIKDIEREILNVKKRGKLSNGEKSFLNTLEFEKRKFGYADQIAEKEVNRILDKFEFLEKRLLKLEKSHKQSLKPIPYKRLKDFFDGSPLNELFVICAKVTDIEKILKLKRLILNEKGTNNG